MYNNSVAFCELAGLSNKLNHMKCMLIFLLLNNIWVKKLNHISMNLLFTSLVRSSTIILFVESNDNTT